MTGISRRLTRCSGTPGMWLTWRVWRNWDYWTWQEEAKSNSGESLTAGYRYLQAVTKVMESSYFHWWQMVQRSQNCILGGLLTMILGRSLSLRGLCSTGTGSVVGADGLSRQNYSWSDFVRLLCSGQEAGVDDLQTFPPTGVQWFCGIQLVLLRIKVQNILYGHWDLCIF